MNVNTPASWQSGNAMPRILILLVSIAVLALGYWLFIAKEQAPSPEETVESTEPAPAAPPPDEAVEQAPDIPAEEPAPMETEEEEEPLPTLENSDELARETLSGHLGNQSDDSLAGWLNTDNLVQKVTAVVDGLSRGKMLRKVIPMQAPDETFKVIKRDDRLFIDESNYQRFDTMVDSLTSIPPEALAAAFQKLRPLFEQAYGELGKSSDKVDNSLIAAIDQALATPEISGPIALKQESVYYQFADSDIEALPEVQKQMLRLGPQNRGQIKEYLSKVRAALLENN